MTDIDFEEIAADLLAAELERPIERFGRGADGGVDLRWKEVSGSLGIAQCKHYMDSTFAQLRASAKKERPKLAALKPARYLFATSQMLTLNQKDLIYSDLSDWIQSAQDILSGSDLDQLLDRHSLVERKHVKLWLSTGTELFWATHADLLNRSEALRRRIDRTIGQYVGAKSFEEASDILEREKVCLIAGQPGIGKTVLSHMLLADHMTRGFEIVEISADIDEAWSALESSRAQIFFYDDFLGQLSFSERMGKNEDARLADFIDRVRELKSKRIVLTTREYILRDAERAYAKVRSVNKRGKYILQLSDYGRNDKARILYNHPWNSGIDRSSLLALSNGGWRRIVDHPNYSPRLIEYGAKINAAIEPGVSWIDQFIAALDDPSSLWTQSFEVHLTEMERALLYVLASFGASVELTALQKAHRRLCHLLAVPYSPTEFRRAMDTMEGTFLRFDKDHRGIVVSYDNPSIVDFVLNELRREPELQANLLHSATHFEQVENLWSRTAASITVLDRASSSRTRDRVLHESVSKDFVKAIKRCFTSTPLQPRKDYYDSSTQSREVRLAFITKLPAKWRPKNSWIKSVAKRLVERWVRGKGDKSAAYELIFGSHSIRTFFPERAESQLETWIKTNPSETDDWLLLGRLLHQDGSYPYDQAFADKFRKHVHAELARWHPTPPYLEELVSLSGDFGTSDLDEYLEEAMQLDRERDEIASTEAQEHRQERFTERLDESDEVIERYFDHF
ncbi:MULTISPECIES: hypothetical protein [Paenarthrobacter]|uniref:nSTAND3 domain-containing NTPase n=1 Tax=Paenarthrobacter TaxID=1742992 RepID=UPI00074D48E0|nr:hypothetical protein [Paenarthrobacter ureafaciens]AMB40181.1 hypothetical protein AUT26_08155 [Arthrobacter sp. ATCC 21022]KUR63409.1 hypothetical protein JM67_16735 [Arthrobacter sp. ATCC 21022]